MKNAHFLTASLLLVCMLGCSKTKQISAVDICDETRNTVLVATDWHGTVAYNEAVKKWVVNVIIPGTIDGVQTCIICSEVPPSLRQDGLAVIISGDLKESKGNPAPSFGGQEIYYINPTRLEEY